MRAKLDDNKYEAACVVSKFYIQFRLFGFCSSVRDSYVDLALSSGRVLFRDF